MALKKDSDFNPKDFSEKLDNLDDFKKEYEGVNFHKKVQGAICESKLVEDEIKKIVWQVLKNRLAWVLLSGLGLILIDLLLRAIPGIIKAVSGA